MTIPPYDLQADDFHSYQLPDSLDATIPLTAQPGEPGAHWLARGLMAEIYRRLLARPITLQVIEHDHIVFISAVISLASPILSSDPLGDLTSVDLILVKHTARWGADAPEPDDRHRTQRPAAAVPGRHRPRRTGKPP